MERRGNEQERDFEFTSGVPYFLEPGFIFFSSDPTTVQAVVGSAVSVCLWDREKKCGGINLFLHPEENDQKKSTPKYGNVATLTLIKMMKDGGSNKEDIVAQVIGGSFPEGGAGKDIGSENAKIAIDILKQKNINIMSTDVGGALGRKIIFDVGSGKVAVLKVHQLRKHDWHKCCYIH